MNTKEAWKQFLAHAEKVGRLVPVYGDSQRQTGKTTALVEYAREKGYAVIVNTQAQANDLRRQTGYHRIYRQSLAVTDYDLLRGRKVVADEQVDTGKLWDVGLIVATGYRFIYAVNG